MFAIIRFKGKQYKVSEKDVIQTEKVNAPEGEALEINEVLLYNDDKATKIGQPYVSDAKVSLKVMNHGRSRKIRVFKMKAKKRYKRTKNWRQPFSKLEVIKITA